MIEYTDKLKNIAVVSDQNWLIEIQIFLRYYNLGNDFGNIDHHD